MVVGDRKDWQGGSTLQVQLFRSRTCLVYAICMLREKGPAFFEDRTGNVFMSSLALPAMHYGFIGFVRTLTVTFRHR